MMRISCLDLENDSPCQALKEKGKIVNFIAQNSTKGVIFIFTSIILLTIMIYSQWSVDMSFVRDRTRGGTGPVSHQRQPSGVIPTRIILSCPANTTAAITCRRAPHVSPSQSQSPLPSLSQNTQARHGPSHSPSCPNFFRYIHEDLKPWKSTGITKEMVESAKHFANFRLVIINGKAYLEKYSSPFQTRDVFTIWGILQLLNRYPGRIPDLDLMFNCNDTPLIKMAKYLSTAPPPLFRYCKDETTLDIVFPDWSFWGWAELNIKPWDIFLEEIRNASESLKWKDRAPYAFWKGNTQVAKSRQDLMRCNLSNGHDWNARLFEQNWEKEIADGFKQSNLAKQCTYRYKIYIEGRSWSVSQKYILACNSPTLRVTTSFTDFFSRGLVPGKHYWPISSDHKCKSIKFAVNWGNTHQKQAEYLGKGGSLFTQEELSMENVYDYMLNLLTEYAKLLRYKPTIPEKATNICIESMACRATGLVKDFMMESMVKSVYDFEPCSLPPPFDGKELEEIAYRKDQYFKKVEGMENQGKL
ncbi:O-glucosyltransferase rumi-like protein (DUF821) [Rhynchospora pubera]|uniref:O-glucosyltransferase rumi-like protein (DUF821) n=1 Tax=Rhynchospora pubera TaxID=906938 RepID=A0AAV8E0M1_9POAL|nr:O-glucosyltransferase rumi-like protein (DUF821) [Rhynchospora pubera]